MASISLGTHASSSSNEQLRLYAENCGAGSSRRIDVAGCGRCVVTCDCERVCHSAVILLVPAECEATPIQPGPQRVAQS